MPRKIIVRSLLKSLPEGFQAMKGFVYYCKYEHIIRGLLIEGTAYKATKRLKTFLFPMFCTHKFVHINHSEDILNINRANSLWFEGNDGTIVADILVTLEATGLVEQAMQALSPAEFLQRFQVSNIDNANPTRAFDLGCAAGLEGDLAFARRGLISAREGRMQQAALYGPYSDHDTFLQIVDDGLAVLDQGVQAFRVYMRRQTIAAALAHGFCPPEFDDKPAV